MRAAAARASAGTSPAHLGTRIAGSDFSVSTLGAVTIESLAGRTTTHPLRSSGGCTPSWNDFARGQGVFVRYSTDNGLTWTNERQVTSAFSRNAQITGDLATGVVSSPRMDEMGGGLGNRANRLYRSTDGGNTWTNTYVGPTFAGPGRSFSGYFATMYDNPAYWRHMGWGEPAALNGIVSYVYAARNTGNGDSRQRLLHSLHGHGGDLQCSLHA